MCISGSSSKLPESVPTPQVADFFKINRTRGIPSAGTNPSIATSPLGLTTEPNIQQKTLLGR